MKCTHEEATTKRCIDTPDKERPSQGMCQGANCMAWVWLQPNARKPLIGKCGKLLKSNLYMWEK